MKRDDIVSVAADSALLILGEKFTVDMLRGFNRQAADADLAITFVKHDLGAQRCDAFYECDDNGNILRLVVDFTRPAG